MYFNNNPSVEDCLAECRKISKIANYYHPLCSKIFSTYQSKVFKEEYGIGGECIHRGYYCPDVIIDIIIGNINRGKICKTATPGNLTYIYGFDENGILLTVQKADEPDCPEYEIIILDNQKEIGITFSVFEEQTELTSVSVCEYKEDKIASYSNFLINSFDNNSVSEFKIHHYEYSESNMLVHCCSFVNSCSRADDLINNDEIKNALNNFLTSLELPENCIQSHVPTISCDIYDFKIVDGYLSSYTVRCSENSSDNIVYKVNLRRKI